MNVLVHQSAQSSIDETVGLQESQATELLGDDVNPVMSTTTS
jgi:hypothetical protein